MTTSRGGFIGSVDASARRTVRAVRRLLLSDRNRKIRRTYFRRLFRTSERERWDGEENLSGEWDERTSMLAAMIKPRESVIEFGAGRRSLESMLPDGCTYRASDIVDRGDGTIVCDLNDRKLPELPPCDVVVFSGVLEYVFDLPRLLKNIRGTASTIVASYGPTDSKLHGPRSTRLWNGWVNDYSSTEFVNLMRKHGYHPVAQSEWREHLLFRCEQGGEDL